MNFDTTDHILWPEETDTEIDEWDIFDEADLMTAENKLNRFNYELFKRNH